MQLTTDCPLRVASILWQPRPGALALTVVCKVTFALAPGQSPVAPIQEEPFQTDLVHEDGLLGSLRAASDLAPFKRRMDLMVVGHAYAPCGRPVTSLVARVAVASIDKRIEVHGDRWWTPDGLLTAPVPFVRMPLRWERAAGGPGTWNPAGVPAGAPPDPRGLRPTANLVLPGQVMRSPEDALAPAGIGPLAPTWLERAAKLRQHAATWRHDAWSATPMPDGIDAAYFNAAPPDQQLDQLVAGEPIRLENLHPEHPELVTVLDEVIPFAAVERPGAARQEIRLRCDTVCIDTDRGICTLTWRGVVPLQHPAEEGVVEVTAYIPSLAEEETATAVQPRMRTRLPEEVFPFVPSQVLPFVPASEGAAGLAGATGTVGQAAIAYAEATPPDDSPDDGTGTLSPRLSLIEAEPMPFQPVGATSGMAAVGGADAGGVAREPASMPRTHPALPSASPIALMVPCSALSSHPDETLIPPFSASTEPVAPPPLWGPLATPEMINADVAAGAGTGEGAAGRGAGGEVGKELLLKEFPIERCAAIAARVARSPGDHEAILEAEKIRPEQWKALQAHWSAEIQADAGRGKKQLLSLYDAAYVGQLEKERGPIELVEYVRLLVATERGNLDEVLAEMTLPRGAMMRIERVWIEKIAGDVALGRRIFREIKAVREIIVDGQSARAK